MHRVLSASEWRRFALKLCLVPLYYDVPYKAFGSSSGGANRRQPSPVVGEQRWVVAVLFFPTKNSKCPVPILFKPQLIAYLAPSCCERIVNKEDKIVNMLDMSFSKSHAVSLLVIWGCIFEHLSFPKWSCDQIGHLVSTCKAEPPIKRFENASTVLQSSAEMN